MKVCWRWAVISSVWALASLSVAQAQEERVGARSEIRTFQFAGNTTFSADDLRGGLIGDADFLIAAHPLAPLRKCSELLKQKLTRGYRAAGFPDVAVEVRVGERFEVRVVEGPRFTAGEVRVKGAKRVPVEILVKRLTERYPPMEELKVGSGISNTYLNRTGKTIEVQPPVWEKGKPAAFGNEPSIESQARAVLSELGFLDPRMTVRIEKPGGTGREANLLVEFENEAEPAVLSEIVINGNVENTRAELLQFLKLTNGMPATAKLASDTEFLLYQTGRFKNAEVKLEPIPPQRARMNITLVESAVSPKLGAPYTREEKAFLAFREWLEKLGARGDVIEAKGGDKAGFQAWAAISGNDAFIARVQKPRSGGGEFSLAMLVSSNGAGLFSHGSKTKYFVPKPKISTFAGVALKSAKEPDSTSNIEAYGGFRGRTGESDAPNFRLETQWEPAPFVALAHPKEGTLAFEGGALQLKTSNTVLRIEESTGKLLRFAGADPEGGYSVEPGNKEAIQQFLKEVADHKNIYDEQRPFGSFLGYVIGEGFEAAVVFGFVNSPSEEVSKRAAVTIRKLFRTETFAEVDDLLKTTGEKEMFMIPVDLDGVVSQDAWAAMLAGFVFRGANVVFPENSWPWTVAREAVFVLKGQMQYTGEQLDRLFELQEMGPVGFYVTASLLNRVQPELAKRFALRGLTRLQGSYFTEDCKLLFEGKTALSRSVAQLARDLQLLDADDLKAINALFPGTGELLEKAAARARADTKASASEMLSPVLEYFWDNHMKGSLRKEFQKLAFGEEGGEKLVPSKP